MTRLRGLPSVELIKQKLADTPCWLFFGHDSGLIDHYSRQLVEAAGTLHGTTITPLLHELPDTQAADQKLRQLLVGTPLFSPCEILLLRVAQKGNNGLLLALLADIEKQHCTTTGYLLVQGPGMAVSSPLVRSFDRMKRGHSLGCYALDARQVKLRMQRYLGRAGISIEPEALDFGHQLLAADFALLTGELEKLVLYVKGGDHPDSCRLSDIQFVLEDIRPNTMQNLGMAALSGHSKRLKRALRNMEMEKKSPVTAFQFLYEATYRLAHIKSRLAQGESFSQILRSLRPPVHFLLHDEIRAQIHRWSSTELRVLLERLLYLDRDMKRNGTLAGLCFARATYALCRGDLACIAGYD